MSWAPPRGGYWKVAHRGASALAPDNSLAALEAALAANVDMVELDVLEAGSELLVAHSRREISSDSPTLDEAVALFAERAALDIHLNLDVKETGFEPELLETIRARDLLDRTLMSSFHPQVLRVVREFEPAIRTGLSYPNDRFELSERGLFRPLVAPGLAVLRTLLPARVGRMLGAAQAQAAMLHHALVTPALVRKCHARGVAVFAWTVETDTDLRRVLTAGADGVIANDPSLFDE